MSKKTSKKAAKKSVSKKKTSNSKSAAKKNKVVKKSASKKAAVKKLKPKPVAKKKVVVKKKAAKPAAVKKKITKPAPKKVQAKKAVPAKKATKTALKAIKTKAPVVKKQPAEKPVKAAKPLKVAVTKSVSSKNLKPIFQPAKKNAVDVRPERQVPDPAGKFELEYIIHTSTPILFEFLTTPSGLSEWFCDDVNIRDNVYSFQWDENAQNARLIKYIEESVARFQWVDKNDDTYFEFRIERDDLTNDISLIVADFADTPEDRHSSTLLWNSQIDKLLSVLGSH
jgi:uncharacterized protein YndB with AHSA1/START domain